jgi:hypothetical protein
LGSQLLVCPSYVRWYDPAAALVYAASGVMKVFMFDRMTKDVLT